MRFNPNTGALYDADIQLNSAEFEFSVGDPVTASDLASVLAHEIGHFFGLSHTEIAGATMETGYDATDDLRRSLEPDDLDGICAIYPPERAPASHSCTPRHGFSAQCGADQPPPEVKKSSGCAFRTPERTSPLGALIVALALTAACGLRRRLRMQSFMSSPPVDTSERTPASSSRRVALGFAARFALIAARLPRTLRLSLRPIRDVARRGSTFTSEATPRWSAGCSGSPKTTCSVVGNGVFGKASLQIVRSCDAMEINILLAAAILAFPGAPLKKALALALGLAGVAVLNITRIVTLYYVLLGRQGAFEFLHLELWPLVMVVAAAALFVGATRFMRAVPEPNRL